MAPDNHPYSTSEATELLVDQELPRFLQATQRYGQFLDAKAQEFTGQDADTRAELINELMVACSGINSAAQQYDFALGTPSLQDTSAVTVAAQALVVELARPGIPPDVKAIYEGLYGVELNKIAGTNFSYAVPTG